MRIDLSLLTARVLSKANGLTAGSAFLFSGKYLLTCSHVVIFALGLSLETQAKPDGLIDLKFPCLNNGHDGKDDISQYQAKVICWYPTVSRDSLVKDIAVLELINDYPKLLNLVGKFIKFKTVDQESLVGRSVAAFGFPSGNDGGELAKGEVQCISGDSLVQIDGRTAMGSRIQPGFSGTAIFDEKNQVILGIAKRQNAENPDSKIAFMIPTSLLLRAWEPLGQYCEDDRRKELLDILKLEDCQASLIDRLYSQILREKIDLDQLKNDVQLKELQDRLIALSQYSRDEYTELERFAVDLKDIESKLAPESRLVQRLDAWLEKYVDINSSLFKTRGQIPEKKSVEPTLLVRLERRTPSPNNPQVTGMAKAWFIDDVGRYQSDDYLEPVELLDEQSFAIQHQASIESLVNDFLNKCHRQIRVEGFDVNCVKKIYFSLESTNTFKWKSRIFEIDFWLEEAEEEMAIGEIYQVMFSLTEYRELLCQENNWPKALLKAQSKAVVFQEKLNDAASQVFQFVDVEPKRAFQRAIRQDDCVALGLRACIESEDDTKILDTCLKAGIPLMLWHRKDCEQSVKDLCTEGLVKDIGESVRKCREDGYDDDEHLGRNLLVFWDLPEPKNQLQWAKRA